MTEQTGTLLAQDGTPLAWRRLPGRGPGVLFLGGFHSDMTGSKASALAEWAAQAGQAFCRFDYSGHGASGGAFQDGTITRWAEDAEAVLTRLTEGPQVLVGSSMGGWIACLLALRHPGRVAGLVLVAPAPDFTEDLMWAQFPPEVKATIAREGLWFRPSEYGEPYPITRALIEDGRRHLLLRGPVPIACPVSILHGMADLDVPWRHGLRLAEALTGQDVRMTLVKDGDHRLSRPQDLALLTAEVSRLCGA